MRYSADTHASQGHHRLLYLNLQNIIRRPAVAPAELTLQSIHTLDLFLNRLILELSYNYKLKLVPESCCSLPF